MWEKFLLMGSFYLDYSLNSSIRTSQIQDHIWVSDCTEFYEQLKQRINGG